MRSRLRSPTSDPPQAPNSSLTPGSQRPPPRFDPRPCSLGYPDRTSPQQKAAGTCSIISNRNKSSHQRRIKVTHLPPTKCVPVKCFTNGFGAVKLIKLAGMNFAPGPLFSGPSSMLHEEGASTDKIGTFVFSIALMTSRKGSRTSPWKLKPKMASTRW